MPDPWDVAPAVVDDDGPVESLVESAVVVDASVDEDPLVESSVVVDASLDEGPGVESSVVESSADEASLESDAPPSSSSPHAASNTRANTTRWEPLLVFITKETYRIGGRTASRFQAAEGRIRTDTSPQDPVDDV